MLHGPTWPTAAVSDQAGYKHPQLREPAGQGCLGPGSRPACQPPVRGARRQATLRQAQCASSSANALSWAHVPFSALSKAWGELFWNRTVLQGLEEGFCFPKKPFPIFPAALPPLKRQAHSEGLALKSPQDSAALPPGGQRGKVCGFLFYISRPLVLVVGVLF